MGSTVVRQSVNLFYLDIFPILSSLYKRFFRVKNSSKLMQVHSKSGFRRNGFCLILYVTTRGTIFVFYKK